MKNIILPSGMPRPLTFFLALEEWVARELPPDDYFMAWRPERPTVICGRNQDIETEVDIPFCKANGIAVARRRSGGGCVYADLDNWMFSLITPSDSIDKAFGDYTAMVVRMLGSLGIKAEATGRNDIVIDGRKVAGNAFYHIPGRAIVHGTMLCRVDTSVMSRAITPARAKLESKGVHSVESRVTSLSEHGLPVAVDAFGAYAADYLCRDGAYTLDSNDIAATEAIEARYNDPAFLYGRNFGRPDIRRTTTVAGAGHFDALIYLDADRATIKRVILRGDFFSPDDSASLIEKALCGIPYRREAILEALDRCRPTVFGIDNDRLADIFI